MLLSRRICTVGDLAALTEYDITMLPVRTPKVANTRRILEEYARRHDLLEKEKNEENQDVETGENPEPASEEGVYNILMS